MTLDLISLFAKSIIIGIIVAMPLGPICMLLIKKTLESGLAAGFADYLTKPIDIDQLSSTLSRYVSAASVTETPRKAP